LGSAPILARPIAHEGLIEVTDWSAAQDHANFVLLRPREGRRWTLEKPTLRGESKRHYSSLRYLLKKPGLTVRIKQSFNDWWVPVANDINLRRVEGIVPVGDEIVHTGKDYHGKPGACGQFFGTTVEAYAMEGNPSPEEWIDVYAGLEPAVPAIVAEARKVTFAERNYWMRWKRDVGPWDSHEFTKPTWMRPDPETFEKVAWASTPDVWAPMPGAPDSIATRTEGTRREMQVLFRQPMTLNYTSWLRIVDPPEPEGPIAPRDPRYPKLDRSVRIGDTDVRYAALNVEAGAWFFTWQRKGRALEFHIRAQRGQDQERALRILGGIL
jgi:hypothetical protein